MNSISLSELTSRIQEVLRFNFDTPVWIRAEISELRENPGGHCYLEFIEKDETTALTQPKQTYLKPIIILPTKPSIYNSISRVKILRFNYFLLQARLSTTLQSLSRKQLFPLIRLPKVSTPSALLPMAKLLVRKSSSIKI